MKGRVFITGASEGLGRCFAQHFAKEGYAVTGVARNEARLKELVENLNTISSESSITHHYLSADLSTDEGQQLCIETLDSQSFDVLINNAGFSLFGDFSASDIHIEQAVLKVNIECMLKLSHAFLKNAQAGNAIINLSSLTYYLPTPIQASYVASKNWIASFSESLWYECRSKDIYVQGLCPGIAKTQFIERAGDIKHKALLDLISVSPESVVQASYKAFLSKKGPIVIPGLANKGIALLMNLLPRKYSTLLMGKIGGLAL